MNEVWKEFFRLKRLEICRWFKYYFFDLIVLRVITGVVACHIFISLLFFVRNFFCQSTVLESILGISFLVWICLLLIWISSIIIVWISENWELAKRNVHNRGLE